MEKGRDGGVAGGGGEGGYAVPGAYTHIHTPTLGTRGQKRKKSIPYAREN